MMGCSSRIDTMSLWEYEALLYHWNEAHDTSGEVDAPDPEVAQRVLDMINANPLLTH
jgi:hypothetical protein